ncbi:MAG: hypothetical protein CVU51_08855 [Deltaproteobacteria bacterium HGW-Deltaproteobacteria-1]|nr:MAG: hypothetical protein CVU51_08855 [Deltaproteobacteria bacterium HGW-Deltaproteobacteria-1]
MKRFFILVVVLSFILSGCVSAPETVREVRRSHQDRTPYLTDITLPPDTIRDVRELRQDHTFYLTDVATGGEHLSLESQLMMDRDYNNTYFSVWHMKYPYHALPDRVRNDFTIYALKPGYGENKRKLPADWIRKLQNSASLPTHLIFPRRTATATPGRLIICSVLPCRPTHRSLSASSARTNPGHWWKPLLPTVGFPQKIWHSWTMNL